MSLGSTVGLRAADAELAGALERAGASVAVVAARAAARGAHARAHRPRVGARRARGGAARASPSTARAPIVYATVTAALLWPRPGRDPLRRARGRQPPGPPRPLAAPARAPAPARRRRCSCPRRRGRSPSRPRRTRPRSSWRSRSSPPGRRPRERDIAAITYAANPDKKGLDRVLAAWAAARREGEELVVTGTDARAARSRACARPGRWSPRPTARCCAAPASSSTAPAARGLRRRPARGAGRRLPARDDAGAGALRGAAARPRPRRRGWSATTWRPRCAPRSTTPRPTTPSARLQALAPYRRDAVDAVVRDELLPRLLSGA